MPAPLNAVLVISTNNVGLRMRPAFNDRFNAVAAWFRDHGVTEARAVFVGGDVSVSPDPLDLTIPADQLVIPDLGAGNRVGQALMRSWVRDPATDSTTPTLVVVLSTLLAAAFDTIAGVLRRRSDSEVRRCYLFVVCQDAAGRSHQAFASSLAKYYPHAATVLPADDTLMVGNELDRLLSLATPEQ